MQVDRDFPVFTCFPILLVYLEINKFSSHKAILNHEIASIDIIDDYCLLFTAYCSLLAAHLPIKYFKSEAMSAGVVPVGKSKRT